ncbi:rhombosortase [Echinimonas agarilytica]|uniref:Rhombosortase n=1 Tax=Echinimonas agarilytica TaxID=1215918 RepID=A0AA41W632_9GAMM|nr:rhombosortase [Echinimonas agarilytica]MCM2679356.1 rhombosortase [Echinimonas agarilytica]
MVIHRLVHWLPILLIPLVSTTLLMCWPQSIDSALAYQSDRPLVSQLWVLLSAPLLHTNLYHLIMNLAAYVFLCAFNEGSLKGWRIVAVTLLMGAVSTAYFACLNDSLTSLVGLSGALHGCMVYLAIREFRSAPLIMSTLLVGICIKIGWELFNGGSAVSAHLIDATVAVQAHVGGALGGLITALCVGYVKRSDNHVLPEQ